MSIVKGLLVLSSVALATPVAAQSPPAAAPEMVHQYLLPIEYWSGGMNLEAPRRFAALEVGLVGNRVARAPRGSGVSARVRCIAALDEYVLDNLSDLEPEALWPLTLFYLEVFIHHATTGQRWLASEARARYRSSLKRYALRSEPESEARHRHSQVLVHIANRLASQGFLALNAMARDAAQQAVSLTPKSAAALYWAAFLEEKSGRYDEALDLLVRLAKLRPDDAEILVRLSVNLARRGRAGDARAELETAARGSGDDVWRILAYQELAQLEPEPGDPRAVAILEEALAAFPNDQGLRLLASFHGQPVDPVVGDRAASPRMQYEMVRQDELGTDDPASKIEVTNRLGRLSSAMPRIRARLERDERAGRACRDVWSR